jgi:hypothetical protein
MFAIRGELSGPFGALIRMHCDVIARRFRVILYSNFVGLFDQLFTVLKLDRCMLRDRRAPWRIGHFARPGGPNSTF